MKMTYVLYMQLSCILLLVAQHSYASTINNCYHTSSIIKGLVDCLYLPVFHNVDTTVAETLAPLLLENQDIFPACTVSNRNAGAMEGLLSLINKCKSSSANDLQIGMSTISTLQDLIRSKSHGAKFISTMDLNDDIVKYATAHTVPLLCGVSSYDEAMNAVANGAKSLKFYPANLFTPAIADKIIHDIEREYSYGSDGNDTSFSYVLAGGISASEVTAYKGTGITGFAVGFDCKHLTVSQIQQKLNDFARIK